MYAHWYACGVAAGTGYLRGLYVVGSFSSYSAAWIGSVKQNVLPWPTWLSAQIRPP